MTKKDYEFLEHSADVKFRAFGKSIEEAFVNSAKALFETIYGGLKVKQKIKKEFVVEGDEIRGLLYSFLEEFLFLLDSEGLVFSRVDVKKIDKFKFDVVCYGDFAKNYGFSNDVKAITYSDMIVELKSGVWVIEGVFDV
jgi:SHS2 domain-containing protein